MAHYRAELTGVFGDPVDDNPTCVLEEAAYAALGLNYRYLTIKVLPEDLETAMASVRAMHFRGINLTMPHKIKVIPMLDELSEAAQIIGAVNTVVNRDGKLYGFNTDLDGLVRLIRRVGLDLSGKKVLIPGTGGTSRTAAFAAEKLGAREILKISRTGRDGSLTYEEAVQNHTDA